MVRVHRLDVETSATNARKRVLLFHTLCSRVMDSYHTLSAAGLREHCPDGYTDAMRYAALLKVLQSLVYTRSVYGTIRSHRKRNLEIMHD